MTRKFRWELTAVPLLIASGLLMILAAIERWWPVCRWGNFDADSCIWRQDDSYDTTAYPAVTWLGQIAEQYGLGTLLLGLAMVPTVRLILGRRLPAWLLIATLAVAVAVVTLGVRVMRIPEPADGLVLPDGRVTAILMLWMLGWPTLLILAAALRGYSWGWVAVVPALCSLVLASPLLLWIVVGPVVMFYTSHDDTPWVDGVGGVLTIVAGLALGGLGHLQSRQPPPVSPNSLESQDAASQSTAG